MGKSGAGLGMAIVQGCVKDHEGYIEVLSAENKGSQFNLYIPATVEPIEAIRTDVALKVLMGMGESVLVVDDAKEQHEVASTLLSSLGYASRTVSSGEEAIEYLRTHAIDVLILDMMMPTGLNGLETYKKILAIHPQQKAIITSGYMESEIINDAKKHGLLQ